MKKTAKNKADKIYKKHLANLSARYFCLLILGLIAVFSALPYNLLLLLTIHPVNSLLNIPYSSLISGNLLLIENSVKNIAIELIPACVGVSAFFLLLIFNLTTPMIPKKRGGSLIFSLILLLLINVLRIFVLSVLLINKTASFGIIHEVFWYSLSILFVVCIWFLTIWFFKIKSIPVYTDVKFLLNHAHAGFK